MFAYIYIYIYTQTYTVWRLINRNENILKLTWMDGTKLFELVI